MDDTGQFDSTGGGNPRAPAELIPLVYQELRGLARAYLTRERPGHTLQATALVHEAYLRLLGNGPPHWESRRQFFAAAAEAMRRILVEHARRKHALKRGGERQRVDFDDALAVISSPCDQIDDLLGLNDALDRLAGENSAMAELVNLHFFAGLNLDEAAEAMGISRATAYRQWAFARAWLHDAMGGRGTGGGETAAGRR